MRVRRCLTIIGFILAVVLSGTSAWASEQEALKIGVQLPLTGGRAPVGRIIQNGLEMALEAINLAREIDGISLELIYEDDQDTRKGAIEALNKLISEHQVVAVIGEPFSPYVLASRGTVEQAGVPYLTGGTDPRMTEHTRWVFRVGASDALLADLMARYVVERLKLKRLAVLHDRTGIHNARAELLVKTLREKYGIVPLVQGSWRPGETDFTTQLEKVKASVVEAVIALGETSEGGPFLRQVKAFDPQVKVIAHRDFGARWVLEEAGEAAEGVSIFSEYIPELQDSQRRAWAMAYQERYGVEANVIAAASYDALLLIAEAIKQGGGSREGIRGALERLEGFRGVMADYTFDMDHNGVHRFYVALIKGGRPVLTELLQERPR